MIIIFTIVAIMIASYLILSIHAEKSKKPYIFRFEDLRFSQDNDGRRYAYIMLRSPWNESYFSIRVSEFSESNETYYICVIERDGEFMKAQDYCSREEVSDIMEYYQTIKK